MHSPLKLLDDTSSPLESIDRGPKGMKYNVILMQLSSLGLKD